MKKIVVFAAAALVVGLVNLNAADAKVLWDKDCAKCHGEKGKGDTKMGQKLGAKDYSDPKVQDAMKDPEIVKAIKDGVKEKDSDKVKMKAFPDYTEEEMKSLVAYIRAMKK